MSNKKTKKLALVYDAIYPYVKGGGERRFYELGIRLANSGFEVHLYGMKYWDGPNVIKKDGLYLHGLMNARPLYNKAGTRTISQALLFGIACFKLIREDFDIIDCCGFPYFSIFPAKLAALVKRKRLYSTWHEVWGLKYWKEYLGVLGYIGYAVEWLAARIPKTIIANSEHTSNLLKTRLGIKNKIVVIPNGIDIDYISKVLASDSQYDLIYVGRLMKFKNIDIIFKAISMLNNQGVTKTFLIIGDGPDKERLKKLADEMDLNKQVVWFGFLEKSSEVYSNIKSSKLLVQPSMREGFGIIAIEANACGVPVLTLDYPENATKHLVENNVNGYVTSSKVQELSKYIASITRNNQSFKRMCIQKAKLYDWKILATKISGVYE